MLFLCHSDDDSVVQLRLNLDKDKYMDVLIESLYMPYYSQQQYHRKELKS